VLNPHCRSAWRICLGSGAPLAVASIGGMTVTSVQAIVARRFAAECFHFMSTYETQKSYQLVVLSCLPHDTGRPVSRRNASPLLAADMRALRKLSA
jgi:hypothetical protein